MEMQNALKSSTQNGSTRGSVPFENLNPEQQRANKLFTTALTTDGPVGKLQIIRGKAGTGKSFTLDSLVTSLSEMDGYSGDDILIVATNGKIRLQGTDIELIAVGEGGSKGNIRLKATENIETDSKKLLMNAKNNYKLATSGVGEVVANSRLKIYGSIIQGVTDAVSKKDSKCGGQRYQKQNNH